ncbi:MAG: zinc ABC transporter substrate-binding protein [Deltaproteobacteria bacterium]|nr:zinc ABC transporter substrate-binding protein [Deltaproteobacteria bacterium]
MFVCIGPHLDLCQQLGGDRVKVQLLLPPGESPATYAPSPQQIQALSRARLFFKVGLPFENALLKRLEKFTTHPQIIDTQAGIILQPMSSAEHAGQQILRPDYSHHQSTGLDPHSWLDPRLALQQAVTMAAALSRIDPDGKDIYLKHLSILKEKLENLHNRLKEVLHGFAGSTLFVYHPAFGYFASAYQLHQMAIENEGKSPKAKELEGFIKKARQEQARVIFVQPQFDRQSAEKIAVALGCAVIPIDPLAADYFGNLNRIAQAVRNSLIR